MQDNQSHSSFGTIRGLHFQIGKNAQAKLVRVVQGKIWDVVADINPKSKNYGQYVAVELDDVSQKQLFIPEGYAHGFSVLSETAIVEYKCSQLYDKESERGVIYNDPNLNIDWKIPQSQQIVSEKDLKLPLLDTIQAEELAKE